MKNIRQTLSSLNARFLAKQDRPNLKLGLVLGLLVVAGVASAQNADPLMTAYTTAGTSYAGKVTEYFTNLIPVLIPILGIMLGVRLVPKMFKAFSK